MKFGLISNDETAHVSVIVAICAVISHRTLRKPKNLIIVICHINLVHW